MWRYELWSSSVCNFLRPLCCAQIFSLYRQYYPCSLCIDSTIHVPFVSTVLSMLSLYRQYYPCSLCIDSTIHVLFVSTVLSMFSLYRQYYPCSLCIDSTIHVLFVSTVLSLFFLPGEISNYFNVAVSVSKVVLVGDIMTGECSRPPWFIWRHCANIRLNRLKKTTKNPDQDSWYTCSAVADSTVWVCLCGTGRHFAQHEQETARESR
jgi:hypothetical protein